MSCGTFDDNAQPVGVAVASFMFGHGETLISHWLNEGHAMLRLVKADVAQEPGTVVTGQDLAHDGQFVWLLFEDPAALRRLADYLNAAAAGLEAATET